MATTMFRFEYQLAQYLQLIELVSRCVCFFLALVTLILAIIMSIYAVKYDLEGDPEASGSMFPPLFTFIFVCVSLLLNSEQIMSRAACYSTSRLKRLHPVFVVAIDLMCALGLLFSAYIVIPPVDFMRFPLIGATIWVSTALAATHLFASVFACIECDKKRLAYREQRRQEFLRVGRLRALRSARMRTDLQNELAARIQHELQVQDDLSH
ncbi:uncharacterized protein L3040_004739 [Drepanopeziza brunnea f. sp. 'multigermtubi']|uniref:MARVEL domain-containing protein n=1 Tax=Marssonina brunnea f. sp. multigermtubi (strain MB_m1) TaxID=1072389 RepID=K1XZP2_MARBU|nr:uncharacterized protein MBM_03297 [Drepanopeziza brunnea f. sp. 'multigermtubi' MB_m1]EKD18304.1 hypothetical protein MBM_03297 [Drepanopeziza brunnea f. sp. 'multigermtubi' MB_m1]KAJ5042183.1 hypothetical protein L3040_004739 [Drepanopeziza brunnea f. sp. 'multigermtubi']